MTQDPRTTDSFAREVAQDLIEEGKSGLRWTFAFACIGAVILGGFGLYHGGLSWLLIGAAVGAVGGAVGFWIVSLQASIFS